MRRVYETAIMNALSSKSHLQAADRRIESRPRALKAAKLIYGGVCPAVIDCLVRDLSAGGVRVETDVMTMVPEILSLQLQEGHARRVRRCWANGNAIGLEFLAEAA
jgi:hypothetical protein